MRFSALALTLISVVLPFAALATPAGLDVLEARAAPDNIVTIKNANSFCMIVPRTAHTDIGDSEHPGGMKTYCSPSAHYDGAQGTLPADWWSNVAFKTGHGPKGGKYAQLTGCIRPSHLDSTFVNPYFSVGTSTTLSLLSLVAIEPASSAAMTLMIVPYTKIRKVALR